MSIVIGQLNDDPRYEVSVFNTAPSDAGGRKNFFPGLCSVHYSSSHPVAILSRIFTAETIKSQILSHDYEIRNLRIINHSYLAPFFVRFYGICSNSLVFELCKCDMGTVCRAKNTSFEQLMHYSLEIYNAVSWMHHGDLVHLDIKPENIFVTPEGNAVLADVETMRFHYELDAPFIVGTYSYCPPELIDLVVPETGYLKSNVNVFGRFLKGDDMWRTGLSVYFMLTDECPEWFVGLCRVESVQECIYQLKNFDFPHLNPCIDLFFKCTMNREPLLRLSAVETQQQFQMLYTALLFN